MDLKEMFDQDTEEESSSNSYYPEDVGIRKFKPSGKKIQFMRGYSDDGELIFDPFDPKSRNDDSKPINYNKRFSKEMKQHHKLIRQQAMYVDQLEKLFRQTTGLGTANPRQLTKTDVELANVLSQSRGQLLQMINGVSSLKKTIEDLRIKQLQKMATGGENEAIPMTQDLKGATILQQILAEDASRLTPTVPNTTDIPNLSDIDNDESLVSVDVRSEGKNLKPAILFDTATSKSTPVMVNEMGEFETECNIPSYMYDVDISVTDNCARDKMGHTYPLIIQ